MVTTIVIQSQGFESMADNAVLVRCVVIAFACAFLCLALAGRVPRLLGANGIGMLQKLSELAVTALAIEFITSGPTELFPCPQGRVGVILKRAGHVAGRTRVRSLRCSGRHIREIRNDCTEGTEFKL